MKIFMVIKQVQTQQGLKEEIVFAHINKLKSKQECRRLNEKESYEQIMFLVRELLVGTY